jgi:excisionase family DNA binding protein
MDRYLTVKTVADELGFKIPTVYKWLNTGKMKAVRVAGRSIRIMRSEVDRFKQDEIKEY